VLRDELELNAAKFGCGLAQCGACTITVDGAIVRSCITPIATVVGREILTVEGLGAPDHPHPLQTAFIAEQAAQCGYCIAGMIMAALQQATAQPSSATQ
jgi:nicotinate dehydrogenase subunit A